MSEVFKVVHIDGKGFGCIATKKIKYGTLILKENPQLLVRNIGKNWLPTQENNGNIVELFNSMDKADQEEYLKLSSDQGSSHQVALWGGGSDSKTLKIVSIFITNGNPTEDGTACGLCLKYSRFNHSCCANAC